jgi:hypothetical protein
MTETATYAVPGLKLAVCPWCKRHDEQYCLLVYDRNGVTEFEVICQRCTGAAIDFAAMRQSGLSRQVALEDFGFRGRNAPWPNET